MHERVKPQKRARQDDIEVPFLNEELYPSEHVLTLLDLVQK